MYPRIGALLILFFLTLPTVSQQIPLAQPSSPRHVNESDGEEEGVRSSMANDMAKRAARERVAALKSDTDKLLKLSVELKQYVDKSDANVLSLDVVKKAEQIEKLAKSVKDKMKGPN